MALIAIADCALEIHANDLDDLFATAARALDLLLHEWLSELIFLKDSERLVFPEAVVLVDLGP